MGEGGYIAFFRHTLSVVKTTEQIEQFLAQVGGRVMKVQKTATNTQIYFQQKRKCKINKVRFFHSKLISR